MQTLITNSLNNSMSYSSFKKLVYDLLQQGKSTGKNQSDALLNYSLLSDKRMKRLDKTIKLTDETITSIKKYKNNITMLVLMESWCGDGAQTLPVMNKIATLNPKISFKVLLRDENEDLMNQFLTNGGQSIPKLLFIDDKTKQVLKTWSPRPSVATKMVNEYKEKHGKLDADFKKDLQIWYNKDKGVSTQTDLVKIFEEMN